MGGTTARIPLFLPLGIIGVPIATIPSDTGRTQAEKPKAVSTPPREAIEKYCHQPTNDDNFLGRNGEIAMLKSRAMDPLALLFHAGQRTRVIVVLG